MTFEGFGLSKNVGVKYDASKNWDSATATSFGNITAGQLEFTVFGKTYLNYCVQLFEGLPQGVNADWCVTDVASVPDAPPAPGPMGALIASLVQDLYARFHQSVQDSIDSVQTAAFQVAIWELTHENFTANATVADVLDEISLENGAFQQHKNAANQLVFDAANAMLAQLADGGLKSLGVNLFGLTHETYQDQLVVVPIPAPVLMAGLGLLGAVALRRRMK